MEWKDLLGDNYVDGMTEEECKAKFKEEYIPKSEYKTQVSKMIDKSIFDKTASELADLKKKNRANMSETEKLIENYKEELANAKNENENLIKKLETNRLTAQYSDMGYDKELALKTATAFLNNDNDTFLECQQIFADNYKKQIKAEVLQSMPTPPTGGSADVDYDTLIDEAKTRGDFVTMSALMRQKQKL